MDYQEVSKTDLIEEIRNLRKQLIGVRQAEKYMPARQNNPANQFNIHEDAVFFDFMEKIPVLIYVFKGDKFLYVNPALQSTMGYSYEEIMNMKFWDMAHPDFRNFVSKRGLARQCGEDVPTRYEIKAIKKNGEEIWLDLFHSVTNIAGENIIVVGAYDITERKKAQEELRQARDELEVRVRQRTAELSKVNQELMVLNKNLNSVVKNMSDGVIMATDNGEFEILNRVLSNTWGGQVEELKNILRNRLFNDEKSFLNKMFREKKAFHDEEIFIATSKGDVQCLASGTPIIDENEGVNKGVLIIRPIKEVHKLVNRFSGAQASFRFEDIVAVSEAMKEVIQTAIAASNNMFNVLIEGESGTGKEMFAQAIHNRSERRNGPFVAVNCGAIPRELVGSELFGYAEGAFTGAKKGGNAGKFELASGGTLFLDEIGDMPLEQQAALLRVIQEKKVTRIGGNQVVAVDVRIIGASNKNLMDEMKKGNFRHDLYYRLNVVPIKIPPLRERPEDIPDLFRHFLSKIDEQWAADMENMKPEIMKYLTEYDWPGNVRELENVVERMFMLAAGEQLSWQHLPWEIYYHMAFEKPAEADARPSKHLDGKQKVKALMREVEITEIQNLVTKYRGNISKIARELGVSRNTVYRKIKQYGIEL